MEKNTAFSVFIALLVVLTISSQVIGQPLAGIMPCRDGETRPCGSSVGICEKGVTTCSQKLWGDCEGGVKAGDEDCGDGLDNDCNGLVDDCGFNTVSIILIGSGCMLLLVALFLNKMGK
jgi:hypothetical protein